MSFEATALILAWTSAAFLVSVLSPPESELGSFESLLSFGRFEPRP